MASQKCGGSNEVNLPHWNWGAFLLTWIWGVGNGVWIAMLALVPGVNIIMAIILGFTGYKLAWDKNRCFDFDEFLKNQKTWSKWAFYLTIVGYFLILSGSIYFLRNLQQNDAVNIRDNVKIVDIKSVMAQINNYKVDNNEECPSELVDLVPKYMVAIPDSLVLNPDSYQIEGKVCYLRIKLEGDGGSLGQDSISGTRGIYEQKSEDIKSMRVWGDR